MSNLVSAVSEGIEESITDVKSTTTSMLDSCSDVLSAEKDTWFKAGAGLIEGLVEGITSKIQTAVESVTDLVTRMLEAMQYTIENGMNFESGITQIVDTSKTASRNAWDNIRSSHSTSMLSKLFSTDLASSIAQSKSNITSVTPDATQSSAPVYSFTQNNYSPKAISTSEWYRQSNNMISRIGKRVNL